jgi:DNA invertase Pin-like site-specific DNA recombinase
MMETLIYIRTSTEDQNPQNQLKDCKDLLVKLDLNDHETIEDQQSAWKDNVEREGFEKIKKAIKNKQIKNLICWDLDRLFRNRKKLIEFFEFCKHYDCKIYSYRQDWLESLNKITPPFNEIVHDLMLQVMGWLAEDESKKKSERVKSAIRKEKGITVSYKGKRWGRKALGKQTVQEILDLKDSGMSIREIADSVFYWDKNNNRRKVSKSVVHKILSGR